MTCFSGQLRVENTRKERDILKQVENRLTQEKESILTEQRNQNLLLTNLKSIQVQLMCMCHHFIKALFTAVLLKTLSLTLSLCYS